MSYFSVSETFNIFLWHYIHLWLVNTAYSYYFWCYMIIQYIIYNNLLCVFKIWRCVKPVFFKKYFHYPRKVYYNYIFHSSVYINCIWISFYQWILEETSITYKLNKKLFNSQDNIFVSCVFYSWAHRMHS